MVCFQAYGNPVQHKSNEKRREEYRIYFKAVFDEFSGKTKSSGKPKLSCECIFVGPGRDKACLVSTCPYGMILYFLIIPEDC